MVNQLYLHDCEKQVDIHIPSVETIIGRDSILQCNDKRISRQHGIIKLSDGESSCVQITSTHSNPIFIRTEDNVLNILTKDLTATLRQGEKFALLPDQFWFEIRFRRDVGQEQEQQETAVSSSSANIGVIRIRTMDEVNNIVDTSNGEAVPLDQSTESGEKRKHDDDSNVELAKKARAEQNASSEEAVPDASSATVNNTPESVTPEVSSADAVVKPDPDAAEASSSKPTEDKANVKTEVKKENADSTGPPPRPSCEFGIRCYRHNAPHRAQFAHPNDTDYRRPTFPPAPDDAPHCPFGASCYRRNPQHFRELQHPDSTSVAPASTQVPVQQQHQPLPNNNGSRRARRRQRIMQDLLMAAVVNPLLFTGSDDEDDNDDLFDYDSDSDEYRPGRESSDEDEDDDRDIDAYEVEE